MLRRHPLLLAYRLQYLYVRICLYAVTYVYVSTRIYHTYSRVCMHSYTNAQDGTARQTSGRGWQHVLNSIRAWGQQEVLRSAAVAAGWAQLTQISRPHPPSKQEVRPTLEGIWASLGPLIWGGDAWLSSIQDSEVSYVGILRSAIVFGGRMLETQNSLCHCCSALAGAKPPTSSGICCFTCSGNQLREKHNNSAWPPQLLKQVQQLRFEVISLNSL